MKDNVTQIINDFGESIVQVDGDIPVDLHAKNEDRFLFISHDQSFLTHGLHKYLAKFFPELPLWLIKRYSQEHDQILDPFAGSGTTNVEALLSKRNSVGIDVDPFSRFISKVKVPLYQKENLSLRKNRLWRLSSTTIPRRLPNPTCPISLIEITGLT